MEKPGNWTAMAKKWEKQLKKKEILRKSPAYLLQILLWDSFQFLLMQTWFLFKRNIDSKWIIPNNEWVKKINGLLQTWCMVPPWKSKNLEIFVNC